MSRPAATVSAHVVRAAVRAAEAVGVSPSAALGVAGIAPSLLEDADARVPLSAEEALWIELVRASGDEAFGLRAAQQFSSGSFDVLEYAMRASETLGRALDVLVRYNRLLHDIAVFDLERRSDGVHLTHRFRGDARGAIGCIADYTLGTLVVAGRALTGGEWAPRAVRFRHEAPRDARPWRELFRAPVAFGATDNGIDLDAAVVALPVAGADPALYRLLVRHADALVAALPQPDDLTAQVSDLIARSLPTGDASLARVARALGTSERTLQRRLADAHLSLTDLVDDVRRSLALALVEEHRLPLGEIAFALGYSEARAFHRAFRRWTGHTPGEHPVRQDVPSRPRR